MQEFADSPPSSSPLQEYSTLPDAHGTTYRYSSQSYTTEPHLGGSNYGTSDQNASISTMYNTGFMPYPWSYPLNGARGSFMPHAPISPPDGPSSSTVPLTQSSAALESSSSQSPSHARGKKRRAGVLDAMPGSKDGSPRRRRKRHAQRDHHLNLLDLELLAKTAAALVDFRDCIAWSHLWAQSKSSSSNPPDTIPNFSERDEHLYKRPKYEDGNHIVCRLCASLDPPKWKAWSNVHGQTAAIRNHLTAEHKDIWEHTVVDKHLKGWEAIAVTHPELAGAKTQDKFTMEGVYERLLRYLVCSDESIRRIDDKFFREFVEYCLGEKLPPGTELMHRTAFTGYILRKFQERFDRLKEMLKHAVGRVSFTTDMWSNAVLKGFMAITVHFITRDPKTGQLELQSELAAFRYVRGSHTGDVMSDVFIHVLQELDIMGKVIGLITLDNASNCTTMMASLEGKLARFGVIFHREQNRGRCFAHVINLGVQAGLKTLTDVETLIELLEGDGSGPGLTDEDCRYIEVLKSDILAYCRTLVATCRSSSQRREFLQDAIEQANTLRLFGEDEDGKATEISTQLQLLRDFEVRWSATYLMISRLTLLYPAVRLMAHQLPDDQQEQVRLTEIQMQVLEDICTWLNVPHLVQEVLSAEHAPTACHVLPAYEKVVSGAEVALHIPIRS
ncbi:hypothetical protein NM688_g926 [Phlebia brevispora]|uniref:Uncharacterized protein n=1 Tax=Phlebia brevispora TaxID=194682 RepID=A0ACC1TCZ6_9APHY|nr:hypothetical protein NM688_g926 [Phlebia brevispora]